MKAPTLPSRPLVIALAMLLAGAASAQEPPAKAPAVPELAVIVNAKNPTTGLSLADLRSHLKLEVQFWSNNQRTQLFLRPSDSLEMKILLDRVYGTTQAELRKYWIGRVFRGEIPAEPTIAPTTAAAIGRVQNNTSAFSVVLAQEVPPGTRVIAIDGKRPGDAGYPLQAKPPAEQKLATSTVEPVRN